MRKFQTHVLAAFVAAIISISVTSSVPVSTNSGEPVIAAVGAGQTLIGSFRVARGTVTLDGANPSSATTGLVTIDACAIGHKRNDTPGDDPSYFTTFTSAVAGRLDVYAWKNTSGTDPTLVASTDADDVVDWVCFGT